MNNSKKRECVIDKFDAGHPFSDKVFAPDEEWINKELEIFGQNLNEELIEAFRKELKSHGYTVQHTKNVCAMFLRAGSMDLQTAMDLLKTYLQNKVNCKHYFVKDSPSHLKIILDEKIHMMLSHRDPDGRRVFLIRPGLWETNKLSLSDLYCVSAMMCDLIATEPRTQIAGALVIMDGDGFGFSHLKNLGLQDAKNIASFMDCFPLWFRGIHIVRQPRVFNMAYNIVYPFLNENARNVIHFHGQNLKSLHEYVDPRILPSEYGGLGGPFDNKDVSLTLKELETYFRDIKTWKL
ncbi:alpha-tocopherol transfer protein [Lepeophtheirus salmonis]|uniref:alpha-tocopherol transfer protein n=1 Tax=Lepeophtheirus salmonis TaxID=72036 RepID=UPI001AE14C92|nr:alpha-tocopherol transfer protein-like [Lepeophtheirus salmonis]